MMMIMMMIFQQRVITTNVVGRIVVVVVGVLEKMMVTMSMMYKFKMIVLRRLWMGLIIQQHQMIYLFLVLLLIPIPIPIISSSLHPPKLGRKERRLPSRYLLEEWKHGDPVALLAPHLLFLEKMMNINNKKKKKR